MPIRSYVHAAPDVVAVLTAKDIPGENNFGPLVHDDPIFAEEADAAKALINQGVDIMTQHTDSPAPLQVAESRGGLGFGQASDM